MNNEKVALSVGVRPVTVSYHEINTATKEFKCVKEFECDFDGDVCCVDVPYYHSKGIKRLNYKYRKVRICNPRRWW